MRDEDIDWTIYHLITGNKGCTEDLLLERTCYDPKEIHSSLTRLCRYRLVEQRDDIWCACSVGDMILKDQIQDLLTDGLELSGGVIRYRPEGEETK